MSLISNIQSKYLGNNKRKQVFYMLALNIVSTMISFIVSYFVIKYLPKAEFGVFSYCISFVALLSPIINFGLIGYYQKELINSNFKKSEILVNTLVIKFSIAVVALLVSVFLIQSNLVLSSSASKSTLLILLFSCLFVPLNVFEYWLIAHFNFDKVFYFKLIMLILFASTKVFLVVGDFQLNHLIAAVLIENIANLLIGVVVFGFIFKKVQLKLKFDFAIIKHLIGQSLPLVLSSIAVMLYLKIDQIMIENILGLELVANYNVAVRISSICFMLPVVATSAIFPELVKEYVKSEKLFYAKFKRYTTYLLYYVLVVIIGTYLFGEKILQLLFGEKYLESVIILKLLVIGGLFYAFKVMYNKWILVTKNHKILVVNDVSGAALNILLNLFLIPHYGIVGAALSTIVSYSFVGLFFHLIYKRSRHLFFIFIQSYYPK